MAALFTWNKDGTVVKVVFGEHVDPRTGHSGLTWNKQRQHFCCYDHGTAQLCGHNGAKNFLKSHSKIYARLPWLYTGYISTIISLINKGSHLYCFLIYSPSSEKFIHHVYWFVSFFHPPPSCYVVNLEINTSLFYSLFVY